ncbi:MAG TPA: tetratricopeptide repeat protein [Verrucomicrobiae bacterium]|nr:tetratricopeptide repeat protein [Verrucomicrobiae bacterium]
MKFPIHTIWKNEATKLAFLCLLLAGLAFWTFLPSLYGHFIDIDEGVFINRNVHIHFTPANIVWTLTHTECANWLPLTLWSFMLDHLLYGSNPWGYHLTNVLLHSIDSVLVFLVLRRMTGATWRSLIVAGLFSLHPLRVESVAWISERKDMLSLCFWMLSLWAYTRYAQKRSGTGSRILPGDPAVPGLLACFSSRDYWLTLFCFALSLMSKPMAVTLPCVLLLLDFWPLCRRADGGWWRLVAEKIPFFFLSALVCAATYAGQKNAGLTSAVVTGLSSSFGARLENALVSYCRYLGKLFWPTGLCAFYPFPDHWPLAEVLLAGMFVLTLSVLGFALRRRQPFLLIGWLWYLGTLVPVLGLVPVGAQAMADRYVYIPSIGILIVLVWGLTRLTNVWRHQRVGLGAVAAVSIMICIALAHQQISYWKDGVSVWRRAVTVTENNYQAHNWLGLALYSQGRYGEAILEFEEAARLNPSFAEVYTSLGQAFAVEDQLDEAISACQKALTIRPGFISAQNDLCDFLLRSGRTNEAVVQCRLAVKLAPDNVTALNNLGDALALEGQSVEALACFRKALEIQPEDGTVLTALGSLLFRLGQYDAAISRFREALKLQPDHAEIHNNLGGALLAKGQTDAAVVEFQAAARLAPNRFEVRRNLGHALMKQGRINEAILAFRDALALNPNSPAASNDLAAAINLKNHPEAPLSAPRP